MQRFLHASQTNRSVKERFPGPAYRFPFGTAANYTVNSLFLSFPDNSSKGNETQAVHVELDSLALRIAEKHGPHAAVADRIRGRFLPGRRLIVPDDAPFFFAIRCGSVKAQCHKGQYCRSLNTCSW